jgi:hypothetical protein
MLAHRGAVGDRERCGAGAEVLDEFAHDLVLAQRLRHREHQVRRGNAFLQSSRQVDADHVGRQYVDRLSEHAGFRLDAAHAPADDADAVDHGEVRIRADQRVGVVHAVLLLHAARQILKIDLVHDADARRHDLHRVERLHAPFQEAVALGIARELDLHVEPERVGRVVVVDLDRMVDDEIDRDQRLDAFGIGSELARRAAHGGKIGDRGKAGKILQHDARHDERDLLRARCVRLPCRKLTHILLAHLPAVAVAQHRLENDSQANGQTRDFAETGGLERRQRVELAGLTGGELEFLQRRKEIVRHMSLRVQPS